MTTSTNGSMELLISESLRLPSLYKSSYYYPESSVYSSKETECSSPKNKIHHVKLRNQQQGITTSLSNNISESLPVRIKH